MGIMQLWGGHEADDDMARTKGRQLDAAKIESWVRQLKSALNKTDEFKAVYTAIAEDKSLSAQEVIEVAYKFTSGARTRTKKAALAAIGQERLRGLHAKRKGETAAKTRVW